MNFGIALRVLTREIAPGTRNVMVKITKRVVEAAEAQEKDYLIVRSCPASDSGSLVLASAAISSSIEREVAPVATQFGFTERGCQRRRREAEVQLGRVVGGNDPVEDRQLDHKAITVKELCAPAISPISKRNSYSAKVTARGSRRISSPTLAALNTTLLFRLD
jgi:hypothetical protein